MSESTIDRAIKVVGVVATGGVFVVFVGAAIHWERFKALGLPANQATAVVPREELVVTGAAFLVPAVFIAVAAIFLMYALDWLSNFFTRFTASQLFNPHEKRKIQWDGSAKQLDDLTEARWKVAFTWTGLITIVAAIYFQDAHQPDGTVWDVFVRTLIVAVLAGITATILVRKNSFWYFASVAFILILVGAALSTYERTYADPKIEPAAMIVDIGNGRGLAVAGVLIAQRSDYVYLGIGTNEAVKLKIGRMFSVKRDRITDLSIGPIMESEAALRRAPELAAELCAHGAVKRLRCPRLDPTASVALQILPTLHRVSVLPARFRLSRPGQHEPRVRYVASSDATVTVTLHRGSKGRRLADGRCVRRTESNRGARGCNRFTRFGPPLKQRAKVGKNRKKIPRRLGSRKLEPGFYRVTVVAKANGQESRTANGHLRVVR